jgi:hypothetical protein
MMGRFFAGFVGTFACYFLAGGLADDRKSYWMIALSLLVIYQIIVNLLFDIKEK